MAKFVYTVFSAPVAGREQEFNHWYDKQHLGDVLRVPGFVAARRFTLTPRQEGEHAPYLALYEIESDDPMATLAELRSRAGTPAMPISPALDATRVSAVLYSAR